MSSRKQKVTIEKADKEQQEMQSGVESQETWVRQGHCYPQNRPRAEMLVCRRSLDVPKNKRDMRRKAMLDRSEKMRLKPLKLSKILCSINRSKFGLFTGNNERLWRVTTTLTKKLVPSIHYFSQILLSSFFFLQNVYVASL